MYGLIKRVYPVFCALAAILIAVSLTCSLSIDPHYAADEALSGRSDLFRFYIYSIRALSTNRTLLFCLTLAAGVMLHQIPKLHASFYEKLLAAIFGLLFSFMQLIGRSYAENGSWDALFGSRFIIIRAALVFLGLTLLTSCLMLFAFRLLDRAAHREFPTSPFSKKKFLIAATLVLLCWIPYYLLFFPGMGNPDTGMQIAWALHYPTEWLQYSAVRGPEIFASNHHPYFLTLVFGLFAKIGLLLGDISFGIALYCLLQMTLTAFVMTGVWFYLHQIGLPAKFMRAGLLFTAFFPLYPLYAICMLKDPAFSLCCLILTVLLFELVRTKGDALKNRTFCILLFTAALLVMLTKNQGVYLVAAAAILCLFFCRKRLRAAATLLLPVLLFQFLWLQVLLPAWNVAPGGRQEAIGLLFQQTARYVVMYPDDVTQEEADAIRAVIDYNALPELYSPTLADPVKFTFNQDATDDDLSAYYRVWLQMFRRHPDAYLQAFFNNVYGSFYVEHGSSLTYTGFDNREIADYPELCVASSPRVETMQTLMPSLAELAQRLPGIGLLFSVGFYPWMVLFVFLDMLRKRRYSLLLPQTLAILSVGVLLLSPANGSFRYAMPFIYMIPFLLALCLLPGDGKAGALIRRRKKE